MTAIVSRAPRPRRAPPVPLFLFVGSLVLYVGVAVWTGQTSQLQTEGWVGLLQRMVALGIVGVGQTFVILCGSIDLSVANLISVGAVAASFIMQGRDSMMLPAVAVVLAISVVVGAINGAIIAGLRVNPLIATLGVGLVLQGLLSASFTDFAGSVPQAFQAFAYGALGPVPYSVLGLFALALAAWWTLGATRFGAHLYAVGGNAEGARLAGVRTDLVMVSAHVICSVLAGVTGLYLASRLRSGAPWVGRDGVYDLEIDRGRRDRRNLARGRARRRLGDPGRRLAVRHARRGVQYARRAGLPEADPARRDRDPRRRRLRRPHPRARRMTTTAASEGWPRGRAIAIARHVNAAVVVFVVLYAVVGVLQPSYLEPRDS